MTVVFAVFLLAATFLTACSKSMSDNREPYSTFSPKGQNSSVSFDSAAHEPSENAAQPEFSGRMVIRNAELNVQTLDFDEFMTGLNRRVIDMGGYYESSSVDRTGYYERGRMRSASLIVRIPADKLDEFLAEVDGLGNVISREESVEDVTDSYEDTEARLAATRTEYETLLGLLAKAESLDDIMKLQNRLTEVRYQMESYEAKLRSYDSRIEYSSVRMYVSEVLREDPVEPESFSEEVSRRFNESLSDVGDGFTRFAKWFIGNLPHIVTTLVIIGVPVLVIVLLATAPARRRAKINKEYEKKQAALEKAKDEAEKGDE